MKSNKVSRREFLSAASAAGIGACSSLAWSGMSAGAQRGVSDGKSPNIIFLLTDDQRWDAMGCMGNPYIRTPHLDRLASDGVLFQNNFVTCSICAPSRASILSGQYNRRNGINDFATSFSAEALAQTYPMLLRRAGYRTGFVGKYGIGRTHPENEFDFFEGFSGQGQYFHEIEGKHVHLTSIHGDQAEKFLRTCSADQPFCLSVSFKAPHVMDSDVRQFLYDPAYESLYADVTIPRPPKSDYRSFAMMPEFVRDSEGRRRWGIRFAADFQYQRSVKGYYRLIYGIDVVLGRIRKTLQEKGLEENTIIIFTSDNGFFLGEYGLAGKWLMYEESIRTPLIIYDPRLSQNQQGQHRQEMTLNIDIAPTILEYAGINIPSRMQGRSLVPLSMGQPVADWRKDFFYEHLFTAEWAPIPQTEGIRTERWKYIRYVGEDPVYEELFDLKNDPLETKNVFFDSRNTTVLESLRERWSQYRERLK